MTKRLWEEAKTVNDLFDEIRDESINIGGLMVTNSAP